MLILLKDNTNCFPLKPEEEKKKNVEGRGSERPCNKMGENMTV
jgi:hypothetical protein